jgi:hypothetical protein
MFFTLRIDLDYVPWDTPDAEEFGHGEPAMLMRLLDLAKHKGYKYQFFASNRTMRAFPTNAEAVLNDGHDLDWFCKHPENPEARFQEAIALFSVLGHVPIGMCVRGAWPANIPAFDYIEDLRFLSAAPGAVPGNLKLFPVETRSLREGIRGGLSARAWAETTKAHIRDVASRNRSVTLAVRPQVLAKHDPKLTVVKEVLDIVSAVGLNMMTCRDLLKANV